MHTIIAGRFDEQLQADQAVSALGVTGFAPEQIATFFVNPAGQHALSGTHEDPNASAGAHHAAAGAVTGALAGTGLGLAAGLATIPILGPGAALAGAAVGAYVGSFGGALNQLKEPGTDNEAPADSEPVLEEAAPRKSGMFVAVDAGTSSEQASAITVLHEQGAVDIEQTQGSIVHSEWIDFDPLSAPALVTVSH